MAGKANKGNKRLKDYGKVLMAKQLLRAIYNNPREKIFKRFFGKKMELGGHVNPASGSHLGISGSKEITKNSVPTINKVFTSLSSRLEIILTAMGGALSFQHARQLINHGKVSVNGYTVKQRNYLLKDGDIILSKAGLGFSSLGDVGSSWGQQKLGVSKFQESSGKDFFKGSDRESRQHLFQLEKKVGGMKTAKLPGYLNIKTPIAASFLINPDLNLGIYYSKPLFNTLTSPMQEPSIKDSSVKTSVLGKESTRGANTSEAYSKGVEMIQSGGGWKNMSVKELKLLLAPAESLKLVKSLTKENTGPAGSLTQLSLSKPDQLKWESLYSLVQAYYLRK